MKLFYRTLGEGPPLVILHGLLGMSDNWLSIAKIFAGKYRVWIPDLRNHGRSPHHPEHTYQAMTDDIMELLGEHCITKPVLLGHSMGGKLAMCIAGRYPQAIDKLIVADIAPVSYLERARQRSSEHRTILEAMLSVDIQKMASRSAVEENLRSAIPSEHIRQFIMKNLGRNEKQELVWLCNVPVLLKTLEGIMDYPRLDVQQGISLKTLFIRGGQSEYILPEDEKNIDFYFPGSTIETLPGAGHWVHADQPALFLETISRFLQPSS